LNEETEGQTHVHGHSCCCVSKLSCRFMCNVLNCLVIFVVIQVWICFSILLLHCKLIWKIKFASSLLGIYLCNNSYWITIQQYFLLKKSLLLYIVAFILIFCLFQCTHSSRTIVKDVFLPCRNDINWKMMKSCNWIQYHTLFFDWKWIIVFLYQVFNSILDFCLLKVMQSSISSVSCYLFDTIWLYLK